MATPSRRGTACIEDRRRVGLKEVPQDYAIGTVPRALLFRREPKLLSSFAKDPRSDAGRNRLHVEGVLALPFGQVARVVVPLGHAKFNVGVTNPAPSASRNIAELAKARSASSRLSGSRGMPAGAELGSYMFPSSRVAAVLPGRADDMKGSGELAFERRPILSAVGTAQGRLERPWRHLIATERKAGAIGAALAHLRQHPGQ